MSNLSKIALVTVAAFGLSACAVYDPATVSCVNPNASSESRQEVADAKGVTVAELRICPQSNYSGGNDRSTTAGATVQERVNATFGNDRTTPSGRPVQQVNYQNDTTRADSATGNGPQAAGDNVPTRTVTQDAVRGTPAPSAPSAPTAPTPTAPAEPAPTAPAEPAPEPEPAPAPSAPAPGAVDSGVTENGNVAPSFD